MAIWNFLSKPPSQTYYISTQKMIDSVKAVITKAYDPSTFQFNLYHFALACQSLAMALHACLYLQIRQPGHAIISAALLPTG